MASLMLRAVFRRMRPAALPAPFAPGDRKQNWKPWHSGFAPQTSAAACKHK